MEQTQKVLHTAIQFGQQLETSLKDGFQPLADIVSFIPVLTTIPDLINNKEAIIAELTPFDEPKATEIADYVEANLTLTDKKTETVIKKAFVVALAIYSLYVVLKPAIVEPPVITNPPILS